MLLVLCGVIAGVVTTLIGFAAVPLGTALGLLDVPDAPGGRKRHAGVTPLVGGLAVTLTAIAAVATTIFAGVGNSPAFDWDLTGFGAAILTMFLIGVADDRFELSVGVRLGCAILVPLVVIVVVPDFAVGVIRFGPATLALPWIGSIVFTLLCLVGLLNAVNMADGKNGIVIGLALIWSAVLLGHVPPPVLPVMAAVAATLAVLFVFNLRGRLFLGDGGSYALSTLFGLIAIYAYNDPASDLRADDIALLFAVPVLDTLRLVVSRIVARQSPFAGGRDHLHHYLHARLNWPRGLYVYLALAAVPNAGALLMPGTAPIWLGVTVVAYVAVLAWTRRTTA